MANIAFSISPPTHGAPPSASPTTLRRPLAAAVIAAIGAAFVRPALGDVVTIGRPDHESASPDAELIRLCAEVTVHRDRFNHESTLDSDDCPIWAAYIAAADAISKAKPQTMAGLAAKAHAAKLEAMDTPDGENAPDGTMAARWAWDLVNDLVRLGGRA